MSIGYCTEVLNLYIVHLKLILHCMLTNWNQNKNLEKKPKQWGSESLRVAERIKAQVR